MRARVLVLAAGSGASNSLVHSLRTGDPSLGIVGCHSDRFVLKKSAADRNFLVPGRRHPALGEALRRVIAAAGIDVAMATGDPDVALLARLEAELPCRLLLPARSVIDLCHDKYHLNVFLRSRGLPVPLTVAVTDLEGIDDVFRRLPAAPRLWCRLRTGSGSMGATPVRSPEQARGWIAYWQDMRGVSPAQFTVSEYLPGRDFACQSLWQDGRLVLVKTHERLSYFGGEARPSGVSSIAALAKTVDEPRVVETSVAAIRALDPRASGAFDVDLKEDADGVPRITEINAGRLISGGPLFDFSGKHNMAVTFVRLALGEAVEIGEAYDVAPDYYMVRDVDTPLGIFHADELFEGIEEA